MYPIETHSNVRMSLFERPGGFYFKISKNVGAWSLQLKTLGMNMKLHEQFCGINTFHIFFKVLFNFMLLFTKVLHVHYRNVNKNKDVNTHILQTREKSPLIGQ